MSYRAWQICSSSLILKTVSGSILKREINYSLLRSLFHCRHIDGNHELIEPYRIVIHGGIDGFSRLAVYLNASTNNRATTVFGCFQEAIQQYNLPSRVRYDLGFENLEVGRYMLEQRGLNRGSIITGTSVHNQRIETMEGCQPHYSFTFSQHIFIFGRRRSFRSTQWAASICPPHSLYWSYQCCT